MAEQKQIGKKKTNTKKTDGDGESACLSVVVVGKKKGREREKKMEFLGKELLQLCKVYQPIRVMLHFTLWFLIRYSAMSRGIRDMIGYHFIPQVSMSSVYVYHISGPSLLRFVRLFRWFGVNQRDDRRRPKVFIDSCLMPSTCSLTCHQICGYTIFSRHFPGSRTGTLSTSTRP